MPPLVPPASFRPSRRAALAGGQPISALMSQALANPELISLAAGFVDGETLPAESAGAALEQMFADPGAAKRALQYGSTLGDPGLRSLLLDLTLGSGSRRPPLDQVLVTAGSNQLLHLVAEVLLDPGDIVLCSSPTYLVFLGTLANLGVRTVGLASDSRGLRADAVAEELARLDSAGELPRVKAIYLVPYFDNPRGVTMPAERVAEIVGVAKQWSRVQQIRVIADEAYRELRFGGEDVPSALVCDEDGQTVIQAGTFSKSYSPGIRVGWGILPPDLIQPVCDIKGNIDFGSPNFNQALMRTVIERGDFQKHVARIRQSYAAKLSTMLEAAETFLGPLPEVEFTRPTGGLYVWLSLPPEIDAGPQGQLFQAAIDEGILYVPGAFAFAAEGIPPARNSIRLSFGVQSRERIRSGIEALARAIARSLS